MLQEPSRPAGTGSIFAWARWNSSLRSHFKTTSGWYWQECHLRTAFFCGKKPFEKPSQTKSLQGPAKPCFAGRFAKNSLWQARGKTCSMAWLRKKKAANKVISAAQARPLPFRRFQGPGFLQGLLCQFFSNPRLPLHCFSKGALP